MPKELTTITRPREKADRDYAEFLQKLTELVITYESISILIPKER